MTAQYIYKFLQNKKIVYYTVITCLLIVTGVNVWLDYFFAQIQNSTFYISESLLFSSFWLLFLPLLYLLWQIVCKTKNNAFYLLLAAGMVLLHLLAYPLLVGVLSGAFYDHRFTYVPTFNYGITAYFVKTVIIYGFSIIIFLFLKNGIYSSPGAKEIEFDARPEKSVFISSILVTDNNNKKVILQVNEIYCILASTPYVYIHHSGKKYLHTDTLKSLEIQLNNSLFVRIHKSCIVNLSEITYYQSRHNGDYDITLTNNNQLRVSRIYAKKFKQKLEEYHRFKVI